MSRGSEEPARGRRTGRGWMCLLHSGPMNIEDLLPEDIDLRDIAGALALINRFSGQSHKAIPVIWHCRMVRELCREHPAAVQLEALLHDAEEAYVGDWIQPLKHRFGSDLIEIKEQVHRACFDAAGIRPGTTPTETVKTADELMVRYELGSGYGLGRVVWWHGTMSAAETAQVEAARAAVGDPPQNEEERAEQVRRFAIDACGLIEPWATLAKSSAALAKTNESKQKGKRT